MKKSTLIFLLIALPFLFSFAEENPKKSKEMLDDYAIELLQKDAEGGNVKTQCLLGTMYVDGNGVKKDYQKGMEWLLKAAQQNDATAQSKIGIMYHNGIGVKKDLKSCVEWNEKAIKNGSCAAMFNLSYMYRRGDGVEKDLFKARELMQQAAELGDESSQLVLGLMYYSGEGCKADNFKAVEWLQKAADKGDVEAQRWLGNLYKDEADIRNYAKAAEWLQKAADNGDIKSSVYLALMYLNGKEGIEKNYRKAADLLQNAAKAKDPKAIYFLAEMYWNGLYFDKNIDKVIELLKESSALGYPEAMYLLGIVYLKGQGIPKDETYTLMYLTLATAFSDEPKYRKLRDALERQLTKEQKYQAQQMANVVYKQIKEPNIDKDKNNDAFGTGFIISEDGYLITNNHVVKNAKLIKVKTETDTYEATLIGTDEDNDLALLKIAGKFTPVVISEINSASLGETVFTVGFPMPSIQGFAPKVTKGVISSLKGIRDDMKHYQIDASVQPGNSGGPLSDQYGDLIGIIVARINDEFVIRNTGSIAQNVNYAIKKSYLIGFLKAYPEVANKVLIGKNDKSITFEKAVEKVKNSSVLIIVN